MPGAIRRTPLVSRLSSLVSRLQTAILVAFLSATLIGITFGFLPARAASRLDPVVALNQ